MAALYTRLMSDSTREKRGKAHREAPPADEVTPEETGAPDPRPDDAPTPARRAAFQVTYHLLGRRKEPKKVVGIGSMVPPGRKSD